MPSPSFKQILKATFDDPATVSNRNALWDLVDFAFDKGAKSSGILIGPGSVYVTVEDFCKTKGITPPPLYEYIFDGRDGFMIQEKLPHYHRLQWNNRFPNGPTRTSTDLSLLNEYREYIANIPKNAFNDQAKLYLDLYVKHIIPTGQ